MILPFRHSVAMTRWGAFTRSFLSLTRQVHARRQTQGFLSASAFGVPLAQRPVTVVRSCNVMNCGAGMVGGWVNRVARMCTRSRVALLSAFLSMATWSRRAFLSFAERGFLHSCSGGTYSRSGTIFPSTHTPIEPSPQARTRLFWGINCWSFGGLQWPALSIFFTRLDFCFLSGSCFLSSIVHLIYPLIIRSCFARKLSGRELTWC